jgi:hypothetical protein
MYFLRISRDVANTYFMSARMNYRLQEGSLVADTILSCLRLTASYTLRQLIEAHQFFKNSRFPSNVHP